MVVLEEASRTSLPPRNQSQRIHWPRIAPLGIILLLFYSFSQQLTNFRALEPRVRLTDGSKLPSPHFEPLIWIVWHQSSRYLIGSSRERAVAIRHRASMAQCFFSFRQHGAWELCFFKQAPFSLRTKMIFWMTRIADFGSTSQTIIIKKTSLCGRH